MANWKHRLELKDLHESYQKNEITVNELGNKLAERIESQLWYNRYKEDLEEIINEFKNVDNIDWYDTVLENLYDWADYNHTCWINTI